MSSLSVAFTTLLVSAQTNWLSSNTSSSFSCALSTEVVFSAIIYKITVFVPHNHIQVSPSADLQKISLDWSLSHSSQDGALAEPHCLTRPL